MYERILIPLDGSELAEGVLPYGRALAERMDSEVHLVRVCEPPKVDPLYEAYLKRLTSRWGQGIKVRFTVLLGDPVAEILSYAEGQGFSLIAMTTHGRSGVGRWALGSVADKVVHGAKVPVLLVRAGERKDLKVSFRRIVLPLDGSRLGEAALPYVAELAKGVQVRLILFQVHPAMTAPQVVTPSGALIYPGEDKSDIEARAKAYLEEVDRGLREKGITTGCCEVRFGIPAEEILEYAEEERADLIAMSTHGRTGLGRWLMGSVADKVLRTSRVPVLLVRARG